MRRANPTHRTRTVADLAAAMEAIAPTGLAQPWDNVGLLAGDRGALLRRVLLCIDLTMAVVREAVRGRFDAVMAYHPPIFKPIRSLSVPSNGADGIVFDCIRSGVAIYSTHTALDAAEGGTNDVLLQLAGVKQSQPIEYVDRPGEQECKLVTFVPEPSLDTVSDALFSAGAGVIGDYARCSFRLRGQGTFLGGSSTHPTIGKRGRLETVEEVRLEVVLPARRLPEVTAALRSAHPYEEPAFDVYPLKPKPVRGIGRYGSLERPMELGKLAMTIARRCGIKHFQTVGDGRRRISRVIAVAGAAGDIPFRLALGAGDCVVTGELRHHDALTMHRIGAGAIALGHWASERPVLEPLSERLREALPGVTMAVSKADRDPFEGRRR